MRVVRNIIALLVNQLGSWTVTLVLVLVVPSYLGPSNYGISSFVTSYVSFFAVGMVLGTNTYLTWRIAREPEMAGKLTVNTILLQIPLALASTIVALLVLPLLDARHLVFELSAILLLSFTLGSFTTTLVGALGGLQRMGRPAFIGLGASILSTVLVLLSVYLHRGLVAIALANLIGSVVGFILLLGYARRKIDLRPHLDLTLWRTILLGGVPFFTWSIVLLFYSQIDIAMLKVMVKSDALIGWYALATRITSIPAFLPYIVTTAIMPALSSERSEHSQRFRDLASRSFRLVALVSVPAATGTILLATSITRLLYHSTAYDQVGPLIVILACTFPIGALDMVLGATLIAMGRQKAWTVVGIIAAVINPVVNLWAIPFTQQHYGNGAIGASLATLMTEFVMFGGALYLRPRSIFTGRDVFYIARCLLAVAIMVPAVHALDAHSQLTTVAAVGYGMLIFALAAYALQLVRADDFNSILASVRAKMGISAPASGQGEQSLAIQFSARARASAARTGTRLGGVISRPFGRRALRERESIEAVARFASSGTFAVQVTEPHRTAIRDVRDFFFGPAVNEREFGPITALSQKSDVFAVTEFVENTTLEEEWVSIIFEDDGFLDDDMRPTAPVLAATARTNRPGHPNHPVSTNALSEDSRPYSAALPAAGQHARE